MHWIYVSWHYMNYMQLLPIPDKSCSPGFPEGSIHISCYGSFPIASELETHEGAICDYCSNMLMYYEEVSIIIMQILHSLSMGI